MAQIVDAYVNLATAVDASSPGAITVPGVANTVRRIVQLIVAVVIDGAVTIDIGSNFTLKFRGKAMVEGDQEVNVGGIVSNEVGTSVGSSLEYKTPEVIPVNILVKVGQDLFIDGAHHGTDLGTPFIAVTVVLE